MGVVEFTRTVYVGMVLAPAATGMKPEKRPGAAVVSPRGVQGWSKSD